MYRHGKKDCRLFSLGKGTLVLAALLCVFVSSLSSQDQHHWPRTLTNAGGTLVMYQPQVDDWKNFQVLDARMAFAVTPKGGKQHVGVATLQFQTASNVDTHTVVLSDPQITSLYFPSLDPTTTEQMSQLVRSFLRPTATMTISLDRLVASVNQKAKPASTVSVNNDPPTIFVSLQPAILLMVNGAPVQASIANTSMKAIVNANWPLFFDPSDSTYYLFNGKGWMKGSTLQAWTATAKLPHHMDAVTKSSNWADLKPYIPPPAGSTASVPVVYYSDKPAEIIVFNGTPDWVPIAGTQLSYPANTDSTVFKYTPTGTFYFLTSGRWFATTHPLLGPWTFATDSLPADFAKIPPDSPAGKVLTFVPGTPEAQDAVLLAQIPTTATVNPAAAKQINVTYAGQPQFEPITGTTMFYATNTSYRVIQVGAQYYVCYQGVWFLSGAPTGPWQLAQVVPPVIYTIPPSSPVYNVTYVTQVPASDGNVTASYTAGYVGTFVTGFALGAIVADGTGWYYPPYVYGGWYYPYPCTYGYHNYYNPYTGAYGYGGSAYGPYGSAHWGEGYNPSTGTYARGATESTAYGTRAQGQAYNPYTGAYAATRQGSNAYGSWGQSVYSKNGETAYTQHASNAYGSAGSVQTSSGGKAAGVSTAYGNTAAGKTSSGDMYADHNGNVYQNTGSGWQKYDNGSWNDVNKSTAQQSYQQEHPNATQSDYQQHAQSYQQEHPSSSSFGGVQQDSQDRDRGDWQSQRFDQYQHSGWGGGHSGGWGGGDRWGGGAAAGRSWGGGGFRR